MSSDNVTSQYFIFVVQAYCAILYLKPRMQIILRGKKVKTLVVEKSLSKTEVDRYKPQALVSFDQCTHSTFVT